ncbi:MAG: translation initiation factor IF-3 [Candidatus Niyogibacteria bacterium]|nr:translation initiation factor IF-3 [Candidatus Niyogibacteria bacterium]
MGKEGENMGIVNLSEALAKAKEAGLDLIEISPKAQPPVCRIMDYGKYIYLQEKKARETKKAHRIELREIRVSIGTSQHDLELKARKAAQFLKEGDRVKIDLFLKGRAKYLDKEFLQERLNRLLHLIPEKHKTVDGPKKGPRGISIIMEKEK